MSIVPPPVPALIAILAFDGNNRLCIRKLGSKAGLPFTGADLAMATQRLEGSFTQHTQPVFAFALSAGGRSYEVFLCQVEGVSRDHEVVPFALDSLTSNPASLAPSLAAMLPALEPHLIRIPYLHLGENDFIYKFRPEKERNLAIYHQDEQARALYQSQLCEAIKALTRKQERSAVEPALLNFGAVSYLIPSHFGFCLGVKNAIERAYETLAENPGRRVFMLSELIHNPFVNADLTRRGLRYLQSDKGVPMTVENTKATGAAGEALLWDTLTPDDIVIIPAFGATDEDKKRLVRKGIPVYPYDATCMLVEKVWKAAQAYGRDGFSVIIHGKHEHEETKATFSNTQRHAPALIVRDLNEARVLGEIIEDTDCERAAMRFAQVFSGRHTHGFDVRRHLGRIAVVNQTTLLSNETLEIIEYLRNVYARRFGDANLVGGTSKRDTLCYATQVNQDALAHALENALDAAIVIGGTNSSNTYQLYRLCEKKLGKRALFIQSEEAIRSLSEVEHYVYHAHAGATKGCGRVELRPLCNPESATKRFLVTGGASCPDGVIQQVISRINALIPASSLRPVSAVLTDLEKH